jgi:hypothetical protein
MIELRVQPGPAITRVAFLQTHPPYSIALDGYVHGAPFLDVRNDGPRRNFNHHEAVDRSCTVATCEQARRAVLLGLYDLFRDTDGRRATLWVNDCDQDVCLATWILMNPDRAAEPLVRQLTQIEDLLDSSGGVFPMPHERDLLGEVRWVFAPYVSERNRGGLTGASSDRMRDVIDFVHLRIDRFVAGRADVVALEGGDTCRRIGGSSLWPLVEVKHPDARTRMVADGVRAAVELTACVDGRYTYTLWRRSEYIAWFPIPEILAALNVAEGHAPYAIGGWGGAATVGGSPRGCGSKLTPAEVEAVVARVVAQHGGR